MRKLIWLASVLLAGAVLYGVAGEVQASRNSSGTYSVFAGTTPVTSLQTIGSSLWNNAWNDMAAEMTLSLDRNGRGGMLAPLRSVDGTLAAPSFSFTSETGSGLFRNGAGDVRMSILGALRQQWTTTGVAVTGTLSATDAISNSVAGTGSTVLGTWLEPSLANGNFVQHCIGTAASANNCATFTYNKNATLANSTSCLGLAGSGSTLCADGNGKTIVGGAGGLQIGVGVAADGSGFKHKRFGSMCSAVAGVGNTCLTNLTWTTAFADANYTLVCQGVGGSGLPLNMNTQSKAAAGFTHVTANLSAGSTATYTTLDCIAVHD